MMYRAKTITPLLWRVIVFFGLFLVISGLFGPRIISGGILFRDGFAAYGSMGKALIFGLIAFVLLARHRAAVIVLRRWHPSLLGWGAGSAVALVLAWVNVGSLLSGDRTLQHLALAHLGLLAGLVFAAIGCMGSKNIQLVWRQYARQIIVSGILAVLFYLFLMIVYALWEPLASLVLLSVKALLSLTGLSATFVPPHTLMFDKFGITVAQYCSGIESIALFTGLYAVVGLLDWPRLNKRLYFIVFPFALLMLCVLNILRVYGLIIAGYYINPQIAFSLFHTYAGLVFFIVYSAVFWSIAYKHLLYKPNERDKS